jgi:hypothetical protein
MQIKKAEELLGYSIFDRATNPLELTLFGNELIKICREVLHEVECAIIWHIQTEENNMGIFLLNSGHGSPIRGSEGNIFGDDVQVSNISYKLFSEEWRRFDDTNTQWLNHNEM